MVFDISKISGLGAFTEKKENKSQPRQLYMINNKVFLVINKNTIEVRCDMRLAENLREKYESVMESRYFGRGGIEIVLSGQLNMGELEDLVRLSYNLTVEMNGT